MKTAKESKVGARPLTRTTFGGKRVCWSSGMGLGRMTSTHSLTWTYTKPNNKLVSALQNTFGARTSHKQIRTHKTHHGLDSPPSPYSILRASPRGPHSIGILSRNSQMGVPKLPTLGFPRLWGPITLCANLRLRWGLKQSCNPRRELFNNISPATWTQGNWIDSWFLVVRSQIGNLTPDPSFGHNLCFKSPNG